MALMPGSAVFLDTNILICASYPTAPFHQAARSRLNELETGGAVFWTSRQVLREFIASTTRPGAVMPSPTGQALAQAVRQFERQFQIAGEDASVTALLLGLVASRNVRGKQVHDANIVATMHRFGISWLLTHNTADFMRYVPDISVLPLIS